MTLQRAQKKQAKSWKYTERHAEISDMAEKPEQIAAEQWGNQGGALPGSSPPAAPAHETPEGGGQKTWSNSLQMVFLRQQLGSKETSEEKIWWGWHFKPSLSSSKWWVTIWLWCHMWFLLWLIFEAC